MSGTLHAEANGAAGDVPIPATVDRIEFEQMRCRRSITGGIIDVHQFDAGAPPKGPKHQTPDPTKPINPNLHNNVLIQEKGGFKSTFFLGYRFFR